jgi:hypothetical protein
MSSSPHGQGASPDAQFSKGQSIVATDAAPKAESLLTETAFTEDTSQTAAGSSKDSGYAFGASQHLQ